MLYRILFYILICLFIPCTVELIIYLSQKYFELLSFMVGIVWAWLLVLSLSFGFQGYEKLQLFLNDLILRLPLILLSSCCMIILGIARFRQWGLGMKIFARINLSVYFVCFVLAFCNVISFNVATYIALGCLFFTFEPLFINFIKQIHSDSLFVVSKLWFVFPIYFIAQVSSTLNAPIFQKYKAINDCEKKQELTKLEILKLYRKMKPGIYVIDTHNRIIKMIRNRKKVVEIDARILFTSKFARNTIVDNLPKAICHKQTCDYPCCNRPCIGEISKYFWEDVFIVR